MRNAVQAVLGIIYFLMGFVFSSLLGGRYGTTQGNIFSAAFGIALFAFGVVSLAVIALIIILRRRHDWYAFPAMSFLLFISGIGAGALLDIVFISPEEYGERGWAWAVGKYGEWRVLK